MNDIRCTKYVTCESK